MKYFGYAFSFLCGLLVIQLVVVGWHNLSMQPVQAKDYLTYIQMIVTFITAVLLAVFNFSVTRSNEQFKYRLMKEGNAELARLQSELAVETSKSVEKIRAEFATSVNAATERLRAELNQSTEDFKARLGQTIPLRYSGYHAMFKAATKYFFAIRSFEQGSLPEGDLTKASEAADDAIGSSLIVDVEDQERFFEYVTESHRIIDAGRKAGGPEAIKAVWNKNGKKFGDLYISMRDCLSAKVRS